MSSTRWKLTQRISRDAANEEEGSPKDVFWGDSVEKFQSAVRERQLVILKKRTNTHNTDRYEYVHVVR